MRIEVNGEPTELPRQMTVDSLLEHLGVRGERVAVEVNLEVIRRNDRSARTIAEGDTVEIVSFVGGGK